MSIHLNWMNPQMKAKTPPARKKRKRCFHGDSAIGFIILGTTQLLAYRSPFYLGPLVAVLSPAELESQKLKALALMDFVPGEPEHPGLFRCDFQTELGQALRELFAIEAFGVCLAMGDLMGVGCSRFWADEVDDSIHHGHQLCLGQVARGPLHERCVGREQLAWSSVAGSHQVA